MTRLVLGFAQRRVPLTGWTALSWLAVIAACGTQGTTGNGASGSPSGASSGSTGASSGASGLPSDGGASGLGVGPSGDAANSADSTTASGNGPSGSGNGGGGAITEAGNDSAAVVTEGGTTTADAAVRDAAPPVACQAPLAVSGTALTVAVDLATTRSTVGSSLMGVYSAVYDNSFDSPTTPPALKAAGVRAIRYPGGSYADVYHWSTNTTTVEQGTDAGQAAYVAAHSHFGNFIQLIESAGATGIVTVNYGSNPQGTGPGVPQEAAAWVAYANGTPDNMTAIGVDAAGTDWKTVSYWANLRAAAPLPVDDGQNFLRISHPTPVGIKYWEVGNELYGNGFYYGGAGWEEDLHLLHNGTPRLGNANLSPAKYGQTFPMFAQAMKAVDPTVNVGAILHWPYNEYASPATTDWNASVLTAATCAAMDFGIDHWYAGANLTDLLTRPRIDIPAMFSALRTKVSTLCPSRTAPVPLAVTEWGANYLHFTITPPAQTQIIGVFATDAYANFMEQDALNVDWLELHNNSYLGTTDVPTWGYHAQQIASYLANGGDAMVQATVQANPPTAFATGLFQAHASKHADGSIAIMLVNTSPTAAAAATVHVAGLAGGAKLPCVGTAYLYAPQGVDAEDGTVASTPIFSTNDANDNVTVGVPAYSVVVVTFPKS